MLQVWSVSQISQFRKQKHSGIANWARAAEDTELGDDVIILLSRRMWELSKLRHLSIALAPFRTIVSLRGVSAYGHTRDNISMERTLSEENLTSVSALVYLTVFGV